ncbi:class I SAM-dependent methyltransferase [Candidatus Omnitrophota bacterium]
MHSRLYAIAQKHRRRKREKEIALSITSLDQHLEGSSNTDLKILEFGCGAGFQLPYLKRLGKVFACDVTEQLDFTGAFDDIEFHKCSIEETSFDSDCFDIIFSNHVIEHIDDFDACFSELRRLGKANCIYAFVVPTSLWLLLSIPGQYYIKLMKIFGINVCESSGTRTQNIRGVPEKKYNRRKGISKLLPLGHGKYKRFSEAFFAFHKQTWRKLFEHYGFNIETIRPLLLYGPSECPIVPTTKLFNKFGIVSSILLIMKKKFK